MYDTQVYSRRPALKEVPFGTKDYGGHIIPKRHKALTAKKIEVEPYKWLEELDGTADQDGEIFPLRALTEKLSVQQGANEQFSDLYSAWQDTMRQALTKFLEADDWMYI